MERSLHVIGHYNPFGEYPSPVVPILDDRGIRRFAAYRTDLRPVSPNLNYTEHSPETRAALSEFHPARDSLFAFSEDKVVSVPRRHRTEIYSQLLNEGNFSSANPFLVLSLAAKARNQLAITKATRCCIAEFGQRDEFARAWYERHRFNTPVLRDSLPESFESLTATSAFLTVRASIDKGDVLRRIARRFNWSEQLTENRVMQVAIDSGDSFGFPEDFATGAPQAIAPETEDGISRWAGDRQAEVRHFASGRLVLALNPSLARVLPNVEDASWQSALRMCLSVEGFQWLKPRALSKSGQRVAYATLQALDTDEVLRLESKVVRYPRTDIQTIEAAIHNDMWHVHAFVAQEHCIKAMSTGIARDRRPVLIRDPQDSLLTEQQLAFFNGGDRVLEQIFSSFSDFAESENAKEELVRGGMVFGAVSTVSESALSAAAASIYRFERSIAVYLLIDISDSMAGEKLQAAKIGLSAFMAQLRQERGDAAGLITFSSEPNLEVGLDNLSDNADVLGERIAQLEVKGNTALIDAIRMAAERLATDTNHIRAIVVLTDGLENASTTTEEELLLFLRQFGYRGVSIYGLAYGDGADVDRLGRLSKATGGETFKGTITNVRRLYELIAASL